MKSKLEEMTAGTMMISRPIKKIKDPAALIADSGAEAYDLSKDLPNYQLLKDIAVTNDNVLKVDGQPISIPVSTSEW